MSSIAEVEELATRLLAAAGMDAGAAADTAYALVLAECWGVRSHGLLRLPHYLTRLRAGGYNPAARLRVASDTGPVVTYDGEGGLGHWQLWRAAEAASERCAHHGVAVAAVGNSGHCGALGIYTLPAVSAGQAALVFSNGPAVMPPWGGSRPVVSTSPLAAGFPHQPRPMIIDLASSAVARGKIAQYASAGEQLPPGWALDADGQPTTDPRTGLEGMLAPLGGAKGFALAFLVEALTGALVGPARSTEVTDMFDPADAEQPQRIAHLLVTLDPARLGTGDDSGAAQRLAALAEDVVAAGGRVPGSGRPLPDEVDRDAALELGPELASQLADWSRDLGIS